MEKHPDADQYKKIFWRSAAGHLPHHAAARLAKRTKSQKLTQRTYKKRIAKLSEFQLKSYSPSEIKAYIETIKSTKLWHGTGKYQYQNDSITDVLENILEQGGLTPALDHYAVMLDGKSTISVSTTPLRIIARSYADTHGLGDREQNRYGSALWWVAYYYGPFYLKVFTRHSFKVLRNYKKWDTATADANGERAWGKKVNKQARHVWDVFGLGSDIPGNYPIVFGIKGTHALAELPRGMEKAEARITSPVGFGSITHLEVPEVQLQDVQHLLKKYDINTPVFPIELGELVASQQPTLQNLR